MNLYEWNIKYELGLNAQIPMKTTKKCAMEAWKWGRVMIKAQWLSVKCQEESSNRDLAESFGFVPIYTLQYSLNHDYNVFWLI